MSDTTTGRVLEEMVLAPLRRGGYTVESQVLIGTRPGGAGHRVDLVATDADGDVALVSLKWQQVTGTAEQKVPWEVICLAEAVQSGSADRAFLVLGGTGWTLRDYFVGGGLRAHLAPAVPVQILSLEHFIALANTGRLRGES